MSLWGNKDLVGQAGTVQINLSTEVITGTGTTFATAGFTVSEGDVIVVGAGATYGHAVISSVTSNTVASIATTQYLIPHPTTGIITAHHTSLHKDLFLQLKILSIKHQMRKREDILQFLVLIPRRQELLVQQLLVEKRALMAYHMLVGLELLHILICTVTSELSLKPLLQEA